MGMFPELRKELDSFMKQADTILSSDFKFRTQKERIITATAILADKKLKAGEHDDLVKSILEGRDDKSALQNVGNSPSLKPTSNPWYKIPFLSTKGSSSGTKAIAQPHGVEVETSDADFMSSLNGRFAENPLLRGAQERAIDLAYNHFETFIAKSLNTLISRAQRLQKQQWQNQIKFDISSRKESHAKDSLLQLIRDMEGEETLDPS
jgi:hypothetical protein